MPGKQVADVVFCVDASGSMGPCFDQLRRHLQSFVSGLQSGGQTSWDLRLDFLAYRAGGAGASHVFGFESMRARDLDLLKSLYGGAGGQSAQDMFFTSDTGKFSAALDAIKVGGDEATFVAIDTALDFPWRTASECHRVVVVLTDEALETGIMVSEQAGMVLSLIEKIHALRVKLFLIGPASDAFDALAEADRSEYQMLDHTHDGLANADFGKMMGEIGKSISISTLQRTGDDSGVQRGLFGQAGWGASDVDISGD